FLLDPAKPTSAKYLQTLTSPMFISPNSIALTSPTSFFVTNDHLITRRLPVIGHFVPLMETLLVLPGGFASHISLGGQTESGTSEVKHSFAAPFIPFANGVALSPGGSQLAIASTGPGQVHIYNITQSSSTPSLSHAHTIHLPFSVDNLAWTSPSEIIVAGHPHFPSLVKFIAMKEPHAPSWVVAIRLNEEASVPVNASAPFDTRAPVSLSAKVPHPPAPYTIETLFQSDGSVFSTSTTGLHDSLTGQLIMSGLYAEDGAMVCKPEVD
ncbi:hypothetical protein V5O48_012043, partial [Marasmius crinis-equi]